MSSSRHNVPYRPRSKMHKPLTGVKVVPAQAKQILNHLFQLPKPDGSKAHRRDQARQSWVWNTHGGGSRGNTVRLEAYLTHPLFKRIWVHPDFDPFQTPYTVAGMGAGHSTVWRFSSYFPLTFRGTIGASNNYNVVIDIRSDESLTKGLLRVLIGLEYDNLQMLKNNITDIPGLPTLIDKLLRYVSSKENMTQQQSKGLLSDVQRLLHMIVDYPKTQQLRRDVKDAMRSVVHNLGLGSQQRQKKQAGGGGGAHQVLRLDTAVQPSVAPRKQQYHITEQDLDWLAAQFNKGMVKTQQQQQRKKPPQSVRGGAAGRPPRVVQQQFLARLYPQDQDDQSMIPLSIGGRRQPGRLV